MRIIGLSVEVTLAWPRPDWLPRSLSPPRGGRGDRTGTSFRSG